MTLLTKASPLAKLETLLSESFDGSQADELQKLANMAVNEAREGGELDLPSGQQLARSLELRGDFYRRNGDLENAKTDYVESLGLMSNAADFDEGIGRVCTGLAVVHEQGGDSELAKSFYQRAIAAFERLIPPPSLDLADIRNNLAFIYEADGNFDEAETCLLGALKVCHESLGPDHEQTATLYNNVGALYFKAEHDEKAQEMHSLALGCRVQVFGDCHAETAQSYGNLALVLVRMGKVKEGNKHFQMALDGFETDLENFRDDYEIVAANYKDVLKSMGDEEGLSKLKARMLKQGVS